MSKLFKTSFALVSLGLSAITCANQPYFNQDSEVGWFFKEPEKVQPKKIEKPQPIIIPVVKQIPEKSTKINCNDPSQWQAQCGFVNPTSLHLSLDQTYQFEQQQMKQLMRQYSLYPNDQKATYDYQKFNYWAISNAMTASYSWQYSLAQHPDIDPTVKNPTSEFALLTVANINSQKEKDFFHHLAESSFLVYFTRTDCEYCHIEADTILKLSRETGLKVYDASLDSGHLKGFDNYMTAPDTLAPASRLKVATVPTLFLYLKPSKTDATRSQQWVRISTGVVSEDVIKERIIDFVRAYRNAIVTGFKDGHKQYDPDFSQDGMNKLATAHTTLDAPTPKWVINKTLQSKTQQEQEQQTEQGE